MRPALIHTVARVFGAIIARSLGRPSFEVEPVFGVGRPSRPGPTRHQASLVLPKANARAVAMIVATSGVSAPFNARIPARGRAIAITV